MVQASGLDLVESEYVPKTTFCENSDESLISMKEARNCVIG
jgi:hypothetical protein